jgi:hypothetical protein
MAKLPPPNLSRRNFLKTGKLPEDKRAPRKLQEETLRVHTYETRRVLEAVDEGAREERSDEKRRANGERSQEKTEEGSGE